jgi:hypothetical protein
VLQEARRAAAGCDAAAFANVPDHEEGAYVFRNGFVEAARTAGIQVSTSAAVKCSFAWRDGTFVVDAEPADPRTK